MDEPRNHDLPAELAEVASRLEDERPALSALELDRIKLQVHRRAARPHDTFLSKQRRALMRSRMAITSMLVVGVLASGTGTGLAVSGLSDDGSASNAQYRSPSNSQRSGEVLGTQEGRSGNGDRVAGAQEGAGGAGGNGVQATRQVSVQQDEELPFTGLAAIPLILVGLGLVVSGAVLRRRLPDDS